jgi:N-carbamoylputrescine amidase
MKNTLTVALLQLASHGADLAANQAKGAEFCRRAAAMGADVALFPEMWSIGYTFFDPAEPGARAAWHARAVGSDDPYVRDFRALARELDMAIALTYLETWPGAPRNTLQLIDRHGDCVLTYAKVHTCDFVIERELTPGDCFPVCTLDTAAGPVRVGAMICYDREFPESARLLMLHGAEIILTPNACELEDNRLSQYKTRAYENMLGMAMANYAPPDQNGHSVAFDGVAFTPDERSRDHTLVQAGESEGIYLAHFDLERMRAYRHNEIWGNGYRHPRLYADLLAEDVQPPFVRDDARR